MDKNDALDAHAPLVAALRDLAAYPHPVSAVEVINTHISSVLLAGEYAYKLKNRSISVLWTSPRLHVATTVVTRKFD